jgi:hypothetical protein
MKSPKSKTLLIHSLLWAIAMIGSAIVLAGTDTYEEISFILTTLWFCSFLILQDTPTAIQSEWRCIRRFFNVSRKV